MNSKLTVIHFVLCVIGTARGFGLFPTRTIKKFICKKNGKLAIGAAAAGAATIGTAAIGTAVVLNHLKNLEKNIYYPPSGSMNGKIVVVTGASSGLGLETAKRLALAGATVVLTSRSEEKGIGAIEIVKQYLREKDAFYESESKLFSIVLDLDSLDSVNQFPDSFKALGLNEISVLINNAGVMAIPDLELTVDGYERTFQSNHLGHFVLTAKLFPYLSRDGAKVINVASTAHNFASRGLDMDNLNGEKSYSAWPAYGASKLCNILFTQELQRKADEAGLDWFTTVCLHPGVVGTDLWRYIVGEENLSKMKDGNGSIASVAAAVTSLFTKNPQSGANTQIFLAAEPASKLSKGAYYDEMKVAKLKPFAQNEANSKALWDASEKMGRIKYDFDTAATVQDAVVQPDNVVDQEATSDVKKAILEPETIESTDDESEDM
jgi:NAD(P)-dependent dehydrogenase (short-subunit alcohol dehydrogenase family)